MHILTTISPVLVMILLGFVLRKKGFFSEPAVRELSSLVYWVGLPCLLFYKISTSRFYLAVCGRIYTVLLAGLVCCIAAAYLLSALCRIPKDSVSAVVQGAFRANLAFIGLPVVMYSFSDSPDDVAGAVQTVAVLVLALMVLTNNVVAVILFLLHQHTLSRKAVTKILTGLLTNPLLIASAVGIIAGHFIEQLPVVAERTLAGFSQMVLPLALVSVGATMADQKITHHLLPAILASFIKVGLYPVVGLLTVRCAIDRSEENLRLAMIFMACPTAASSYILAGQLGGDRQLTATIVVVCTLLSFISLSLAVGLF